MFLCRLPCSMFSHLFSCLTCCASVLPRVALFFLGRWALSLVSFLDDDLHHRAGPLPGVHLEAQWWTIPFVLSRPADLSVQQDVSVSSWIDDSHQFMSHLELSWQMTPFVPYHSTCCVLGCPSMNFAHLVRQACVLVLHVDNVKHRSPLCLKTLWWAYLLVLSCEAGLLSVWPV